MNSSYATVRLIAEDAVYFFGRIMFLYIVLPLTGVWIALEYFFGATIDVSLSVTAYFFIIFFSIMSHLSLYNVAIGFGSTRVQLLKVYYGLGTVAVILSLILLNILQYVLHIIFSRSDLGISVQHPWEYFVGGYQFFGLLGMEILFGIFLFGVPFLLYSIYFRFGMRKTTILFMFLLIIGMLLYYGDYLNRGMEWFLGLDIKGMRWFLITLFSVGGIGAMLLTYPIMRNASLQRKTRKD